MEAQQRFDARHYDFAEQKADYEELLAEGKVQMTPTEFDYCGIKATRELGKDLSIAERAYEEAIVCRKKLARNQSGQETDFDSFYALTWEYDGYSLSWDDDGSVKVPRKSIHTWLAKIPDIDKVLDITDLYQGAGHEFGQEDQEVLEGCDILSAAMSDSWSCHDLTRHRKRIDRWRKIAGRER